MSDKVDTFLNFVGEFVEGLKERDLNDFCTPDFVQKSVTSIFISETQQHNGFRNNAPASAGNSGTAAGSTKTVEGTLQKKKANDNASGKKQYSVQINGEWYNTLQQSAFGGVKFQEGQEVIAEVKSNQGSNGKTYWNLISLKPADDDGSGPEIPF